MVPIYVTFIVILFAWKCDFATVPSNHRNMVLLPKICGRRPQSTSHTGYSTSIYDFPWTALLQYEGENTVESRMLCLGSLVNERYVLAPAHCLRNLPEGLRLTSVRLGDKDTGSMIDCELTMPHNEQKCSGTYQEIQVEEVVVHPEYSNSSLNFDVGLVRLRVQYDPTDANVAPVCLPVSENMINLNLDGLPGVVVGYDRQGDCSSDRPLIKTYHPVLINTRCAEMYPNLGTTLEDSKLCAGGKDGGDVCMDMIGGLFIVSDLSTQRKYIQYGILGAVAQTCNTPSMPGVYTPVTLHMQWILDQLKF